MNIKKEKNDDLGELPLPAPWPGANERIVLGLPLSFQPIQLLETFSDKQFENIVLGWANEYLKNKYNQVQRFGGANDKGRDIVAWIDGKEVSVRRWDNYQCKHYANKLGPSDFWEELGKLIYFTFIGDYSIPQNYFIITAKGIGPTLTDLINTPDNLRDSLLENWGKYCQRKITKTTDIKLTKELREYINGFSFSIIHEIPPLDFLAQHEKTRYHYRIFGVGLKKRIISEEAPSSIKPHEVKYVQKMYKAFGDHLDKEVSCQQDFEDNQQISGSFKKARVCFYKAETLKEFSRENFCNESIFEDLRDQIYEGIEITINKDYKDGYQRMIAVSEKSQDIQIEASVLKVEMRPDDRVGICHHLANEDKIDWIKSEK